MFSLTFINENNDSEYKYLHMGGSREHNWRIKSISGIMLPEVSATTSSYIGDLGQRTVKITPRAREIKILGSLVASCSNERRFELERASRVLDPREFFTLKINADGKYRRINARCEEFEILNNTKRIVDFSILLVCDNPFFMDYEDIIIPLFKRTDNLQGAVSLPFVFSSKTNRINAINNGDCNVEPLIILNAQSDIDKDIIITNETTGAKIELLYHLKSGDEVLIDIKNRKITSSLNGNILNYKSKDTILADFYLARGRNVINMESISVGTNLNCYIKYANMYLEAVN